MSNKQYVSLARLSDFLDNIKAKYSQIGHKHTISDLTDYKLDTSLSSTSNNPIANSAVDAEFEAVSQAMGALDLALDGKSDTTHKHDDLYDKKGAAKEVSDTLKEHTDNTDIHVTTSNKSNWNSAYTHSQSTHARTDATKVEMSKTNGNILINGVETSVYNHLVSGVTPGRYTNVTVDSAGHVVDGSNPTTLKGYGITDAETKSDASAKLTEAKTYTDQSLVAYAKTADLGALAKKDSLTAADVGALPNTTVIPDALADLTADSTHRTVTDTEKSAWNAKANTSDIPTKVSQLTNDSKYLTSYTETDPTVPAWAKAANKPSYTKSEIGLGNVDNVKQYSANNPPVVVQDTAPSDTSVIWVDIDDDTNDVVNVTQVVPEFVNSIEECTDTSKIYVLPDCHLYAYMAIHQEVILLSKNWLLYAVDENNNTYFGTDVNGNPTQGYSENTRVGSGHIVSSDSAAKGWDLTGFIPIRIGDVVRLENIKFIDLTGENGTTSRANINFYDENYNWVTSSTGYSTTEHMSDAWSAVYNNDGDVIQFTIPTVYNNTIRFARFCFDDINKNSVITINEEIIYSGGEESEYTNWLTSAMNPDGSIYNGIGYAQYKRLSASGGYTESTSEKQFLTGFIPAKANYVIRFKNISMPYGTDGTHESEVYLCDNVSSPFTVTSNPDAHELPSTWVVEYDSSNNITKIIVSPDYKGSYIRFNLGFVDGSSIITVNEEIKFSSTFENILDSVGYTESMRISASGGYVEKPATDTGVDLTGYIPVKFNDVLRFKNITIPKINTGNYENTIYMFTSEKVGTGSGAVTDFIGTGYWAAEWDENDNLVQLTYGGADGCIRMNATHIDDTSIITINTEIPENIDQDVKYKWKNTGHAFVPADYEDRVIECETKVNSFAARISSNTTKVNSAISRIEALEENGVASNDDIPSYWQSHIDERVNDIREAMESAGRNKSAFLWYHDVHWNYGSQMSPKLLNYLYKHTPINKVNFGGDIVNNEPTTLTDRETMKYLWDWRNAIRDLPNHHSVVGNHDDGNTTNKLFPSSYIYAFLLASEECPEIVHGDDFYYYIDDACEKTRYLYLDTAYNCYSSSDAAQTAFVKEALKSTPAGWHIVAISHIWVQMDYSVSPAVPGDFSAPAKELLDIFDAYNARTGEFSGCSAKVEFCIGGHTHIDLNRTSTGGIPVIITETDSRHVRGGLSYNAGTITESSVNAIIADYNNKKVNVIRVGRGNSRVVYLNIINLIDTIGYTDSMRFSASNGVEKTDSGCVATGYIDISGLTYDDTYYFWGAEFNNSTASLANKCVLVTYDTYKTVIGQTYINENTALSDLICNFNGNVLTIKKNGSNIPAYIRISGVGSGANLIATKNQVI